MWILTNCSKIDISMMSLSGSTSVDRTSLGNPVMRSPSALA